VHCKCRDIGFGAFSTYYTYLKTGYEHLAIRVQKTGCIVSTNTWRRWRSVSSIQLHRQTLIFYGMLKYWMPAEALSTRPAVISIISIAAIIPSWSTIITTTSIHEGRWSVILSCLSSLGRKDDPGSRINTQVVADDCKPARIMSTTTLGTTNVSVVAPYFGDFGIKYPSSECLKDLTLTVERYIHILRYYFVSMSLMFTCSHTLRTSVRYSFFSDST
jgi:hypothetical protein